MKVSDFFFVVRKQIFKILRNLVEHLGESFKILRNLVEHFQDISDFQ